MKKYQSGAKTGFLSLIHKNVYACYIKKKQIPTLLPPIIVNGPDLKSVYSHKHLGLILTKKMTWSEHILSFTNKAKKRIHLLSAFKYSEQICTFSMLSFFCTPFIRIRIIDIIDIIDNCFKQRKLMIENLQYAALRLVTGAKKGTSRGLLLKDCG